MRNYKSLQNGGRLYAPDECPYCHITQICTYVSHYHKDNTNQATFVAAWRCTNNSCNRLILVENSKEGNSISYSIDRFIESYPVITDIPQPVKELKNALDPSTSSKFEKTYLQSIIAESAGLDEIAGMGFRKSIEYLVKDLAALKKPSEITQIVGKTLTAVVKDYFDGDLKDVLERAVWLGNDQTHYFKIFQQFDIIMLKELIAFVLSDLDREYKRDLYNKTIIARNGAS